MAQKTPPSYLSHWLTRQVVGLGLGLGLLVLFGCLAVGVSVIPEPWLSREVKPWVFLGGFMGGVGLVLVGVLTWVFLSRKRAHAQLDEAFAALGLTGRGYLLSGRQYHGVYQGREVHVYYHISGGRYLRTPNLQMYIGSNVRTRLQVVTNKGIARLGNALVGPFRQQPPLALPGYEALQVHPLDAAWGRQLLTDPEVQAAVLRLVGPEVPGLRSLVLGPAALYVQMRYFTLALVTPMAMQQWANDLSRIAQAAESLGPPTQTVQESRWERAARVDRSRFNWIGVGVVVLLLGCPLVAMGAFFGVLALLGQFP